MEISSHSFWQELLFGRARSLSQDLDDVKIPLYSFSVSSYSIGKWRVMEMGQPWSKAMSFFLRLMETT